MHKFFIRPLIACFDMVYAYPAMPLVSVVMLEVKRITPLLAGIMTLAACLAPKNAPYALTLKTLLNSSSSVPRMLTFILPSNFTTMRINIIVQQYALVILDVCDYNFGTMLSK
ncbi:hypothetical protein Ancab_031545 [Ancistrocladus abbreviatus]